MSEMVERVACRLFGKWRNMPPLALDEIQSAWGRLSNEAREPWLESARIALAAMRDPVGDMLKAAANIHGAEETRLGVGIDCFLPLNCWRAMVDEALR